MLGLYFNPEDGRNMLLRNLTFSELHRVIFKKIELSVSFDYVCK
jgi:hypothetical protein